MIACHDPGSFKDPDQYLPERWLNDNNKSSCRSSDAGGNIVVPFGIGKRQCPGRRFVEMELILILAKVIGVIFIFNLFQFTQCNLHNLFCPFSWPNHSISASVINWKWSLNFYWRQKLQSI